MNHPGKWAHSGYREIQRPPKRYAIIDLREFTTLCGFADSGDFQSAHRQWVEQTLERGRTVREDRWSEAIAVGSLAFVESVKSELSGANHVQVDIDQTAMQMLVGLDGVA